MMTDVQKNAPTMTGRLLVATPVLGDPNFRRTVVLMLDHTEAGALGVVLNRPLVAEVSTVLPAWQKHVTAPRRLFQGGPVGLDSALGVVVVPGDDAEPPGVRRLVGSLGLVDLDTAPSGLSDAVTGLRIFAGYSGWGAGQVEKEIAAGSWFVVEAESRDPFTPEPERLWTSVLRRQRGDLALVSTFPDDPRQN
jgi:putative transcriptional regulator